MRKRKNEIVFMALILCMSLGLIFGGMILPAESAAKKDEVVELSPDFFGPITLGQDELIRVNVFNDDPLLEVEYVVEFIDIMSGIVVEEIYSGRIFPLEGTCVEQDPFIFVSGMPVIVIISAESDPDGDGVNEDHPVNISSVEVINVATQEIRVIRDIH